MPFFSSSPDYILESLKNDGVAVSLIMDENIRKNLYYLSSIITSYPSLHSLPATSPLNKPYLTHITDLAPPVQLLSIALSPPLLELITSYFGFFPTLYNVEVWFSLPHKNSPLSTEFFHRDGDDKHLLKVYLPLSPIGPENGPFQYIRSSHRPKLFDKYRLPSRTTNESLPKHRTASLALNEDLANHPDCFTYLADLYSICIADTNGIHRGVPLQTGSRIQIVFTYTSQSPTSPLRQGLLNLFSKLSANSYTSSLPIS